MKFGRFETSGEMVSLTWIDFTKLMGDITLYQSVISLMRRDIENITSPDDEVILVGLNYWGAIFSARLGASLNFRSCSLGLRGDENSYDEREVLNSHLIEILKSKKHIVLITDVVASGESLVKFIDDISDVNSTAIYTTYSVICDVNQCRNDRLSVFDSIRYVFGGVEMPMIDKGRLPGTAMHESEIVF